MRASPREARLLAMLEDDPITQPPVLLALTRGGAMRRIVGSVAIIGTIGLGLVGSAQAANTYLLCSAGAGKGLVSPSNKGECRKHQHAIVLATSSALNSLKRRQRR